MECEGELGLSVYKTMTPHHMLFSFMLVFSVLLLQTCSWGGAGVGQPPEEKSWGWGVVVSII